MQVGKIEQLTTDKHYDLRTIGDKVAMLLSPSFQVVPPMERKERPSWDEYFINIAHEVAKRATCDRAQVGCVLVREKRLLTTGFNGACSGLPSCDEVGHLMHNGRCVRTLHAEQNAIIQAALHGVSTQGSTAYVTHYPCILCAKMLINAGIQRVVYAVEYAPLDGAMFFEAAGIVVERLEL